MGALIHQARRDLALAMYRANAPKQEIMAAVGCGHDTVRQWARAAGLPAMRRWGDPPDREAIDRALAIYNEDLRVESERRSAEQRRKAAEHAKAEAAKREAKDCAKTTSSPKAPSPEEPRGYVCGEDCTCLLCQLAMPEPVDSRRALSFALRLDLG